MSHQEPLSHQRATVRIANKYKGDFEFGWLGGSFFYNFIKKKYVCMYPVPVYRWYPKSRATQPPDVRFNQ